MTPEVTKTHAHYVYSSGGDVPFKHIKHLGKGSFGVVDEVEGVFKPFRAQVYARKILWIPPRNAARKTKDIQNEVEVAKQANHVHLVRLVATYICGKEFAMIMQPVAEQTLGDYLEAVDGICLDAEGCGLRDRLLPWFGCLVSATNYLHMKNIRHRDIKPKNILILGDNVLLTDFGISKDLPENTLSISTDTTGTPRYRAPEVDNMHRFGRKADIFSLGAVFLEMITVHHDHGQLARLRCLLEESKPATYSANLEIVFRWMETLKTLPRNFPWYSTMLYLCKIMLEPDRVKRPAAIALRQCWSYHPFPVFPTIYCTCNPNEEEEDCESPEDIRKSLEKACRDGLVSMIDLLIENGADVSDSSAILAACQTGQKEVVELLVRRGADANTGGALHQASIGGFEDVVKILLNNKANVNAKYEYMSGGTALHSAAKFGHIGVAQNLLDASADLNATDDHNWTALHRATTYGNDAVALLLIEQGADIDAWDDNGWTALHRAVADDQKIVARLLVEHGADINANNDLRAKTPLHFAARHGHDGLVQFLVKKGANIGAKDTSGWTPLHLAARYGHLEAVRLLLRYGSDIHDKNNSGHTALHQAIKGNHKTVIRLLERRQALLEKQLVA